MRPLLLDEVKNVIQAEIKTALQKGLVRAVSIDSREDQEESLFFALRGENFDGHDFIDEVVRKGARAIVVDRNLPISGTVAASGVSILKVDDSIKALGRLSRFYRKEMVGSVDVVGITGSNGKTTVREMVYHVLSKYRVGCRSPKNFNNSIGVPLTLFQIESGHQFAVIEIGTNAPGEVANLSRIAQMDVAVITHVGPSHLEGLGDINGVAEEKASIVAGLKDRGIIITGVDHPGIIEKLRGMGRTFVTCGMQDDCDVRAVNLSRREGYYSFETNDRCPIILRTPGLHNVKNALLALATVRRLGVTSSQFADAIEDFRLVSGRLNYRQINGITIIDDSYNANPSSMDAALEELLSNDKARRRVLICGDMQELGTQAREYHRQLGRKAAGSKVDLLLAVGELSACAAKSALDAGMGWSSVQRAINSKRMARLVKPLIQNGDVILVKGSRSMEMEKIVESLGRWRGKIR